MQGSDAGTPSPSVPPGEKEERRKAIGWIRIGVLILATMVVYSSYKQGLCETHPTSIKHVLQPLQTASVLAYERRGVKAGTSR